MLNIFHLGFSFFFFYKIKLMQLLFIQGIEYKIFFSTAPCPSDRKTGNSTGNAKCCCELGAQLGWSLAGWMDSGWDLVLRHQEIAWACSATQAWVSQLSFIVGPCHRVAGQFEWANTWKDAEHHVAGEACTVNIAVFVVHPFMKKAFSSVFKNRRQGGT